MSVVGVSASEIEGVASGLEALYQDLHIHPELSKHEDRTAGIVADRLAALGLEVTTGVGGNGVVGVLSSGTGPVVMLRADMDALPVREQTGLPYASAETALAEDGTQVPVMHACGHDMHVTCLLGAIALLARHRDQWQGTVVAVFQPGEETAVGAKAMLADGFLDRFPRPDVCLSQHLWPFPAGHVGLRAGVTLAAADNLQIRLHGRGGHGSMPEAAVDPVVMAAATVLRLQTVVSREIAPGESAVITVGSLQAGTRENIIPDTAELKVNVRSFDGGVRSRALAAIRRIVVAEAAASNAERSPEITELSAFPLTVNDPEATARVAEAFRAHLGEYYVHELPVLAASEDFGAFGAAAGAPSVFWVVGSYDPAEEARFASAFSGGPLPPDVPTNHSPMFAPVINPTIGTGILALLAAASVWLT